MKLQRVNYDADEKEDRLSDLPDCIVLDIFSFLNAKQVVQTSVLSTRWHHLWKYLPTLSLVSSHFDNFDDFIRFVINFFFFLFRDGDFSISLHKLDFRYRDGLTPFRFRHHAGDGVSPDLLNSMLTYAVSRSVKELKICMRSDIQLFPSCISSCHSLTHLNFFVPQRNPKNPNGKVLFPNSLNLPSLIHLHIGRVAFHGGVDIFSGFPRLNRMMITHFEILGEQNLCISSTSLVVLAMEIFFPHHWKIQLSTPNLSTFSFIGTPSQIMCASRLSSLKYVQIYPEKMNYVKAPSLLLSLLHELAADIQSLKLCSNTLQVLSLLPDVSKIKLNSLYKLESLRIRVKEISNTLFEPAGSQEEEEEVAKLIEAFKKVEENVKVAEVYWRRRS
ncbi:putative F-box/LRR-repeat protein At4g15060 isoform X1 [Vicia villosa]|uniref:putative F-box/LRR-repeat protein At4g15060 isoform X1 n=1 Tax=Vicia villosa TaxID=3911 RepID=UPI00273A9E8C|nr:putative F-box/LRR-repeat protein At4g15060 isoform X1 [Vicia villosa]XP_058736356.1 putative F-box/LRR-repeat protein At4g15060 isoform X1 [Vicia villosa]XP_058736357.1 putative F-box/LRR-repeat protein At4g15060 isoform X1 [Vicia villosa]XP_058736358.1 putative F-box/LRR-repeat protein At4g15060 isoform X1 [Vicia villosa]XP_058736359.1 putative F-box/LRR-repeat protein At4g15060 isoform X1 [Vicia villosa]